MIIFNQTVGTQNEMENNGGLNAYHPSIYCM